MAISEEDRVIISELRDNFAVNLSKFFKLAMREHLKELNKIKTKSNKE
jgi:hypothetical protein